MYSCSYLSEDGSADTLFMLPGRFREIAAANSTQYISILRLMFPLIAIIAALLLLKEDFGWQL